MQPLQYDLASRGKPASFYTHGNTKSQQSCSHSNAICTTNSRNAKNYAHGNNHSLQNTEEEPITSATTPAATAAHTRYLFHRRQRPFHTEKYQNSCSGFLPKPNPRNIHAAITIYFAISRSKPTSLYTHGIAR